MNLLEINQAIQALYDVDTLDEQTLKDTMEVLEISRNEKMDYLATLRDKSVAEAEWADKKIKELQQFKKSRQNKAKLTVQWLTDTMDAVNIKEIKTDTHIFKTRNYKASVNVPDLRLLPEEFIIKEEVIKADKTKLYQALKEGKQINGASLKPNRGVVIK